MTNINLIGKYCQIGEYIYQIVTLYGNCDNCINDDITNFFIDCPTCNGKEQKFVKLRNQHTELKYIDIDRIKLILDYVPPVNKYEKNTVIALKKSINGIKYRHNYFILDYNIFYKDIIYKLEDTHTRKELTMTETEIDKNIMTLDDDDINIKINDYVYVEYKYYSVPGGNCDYEYKYGQIIDIKGDKFKIQFNENNFAFVSQNRLKKYMDL